MKAVGIFDTVDGGSVLADLDLPGASRVIGADGQKSWSAMFEAAATFVVPHSPNHTMDWHPATGPVISIVVAGGWEIEATNGDRRKLSLGSILVVMDRYGKGHRSHWVEGGGESAVMGIRLTEKGAADLRAACIHQLPAGADWRA